MTRDLAESSAPIRGSMTALVTPFREGQVDWKALTTLVERQIEGGTDWLVPCGTTGESPTLTEEERQGVIEKVVEIAADRLPVMAGTGSNSTAVAIERTKHAASVGAQAALVVAPYYNRPTPEGLYRHFAAIAQAVDMPIVLYNVPSRTGINVTNDVVVRLCKSCQNIVAIKHATGSVDGVTDLLSHCEITVLSGDDAITWPLLALGATGVVSVVSNLSPELLKSLVQAGFRGDVEAVRPLHRKLVDLADGLGQLGPNPIPIKTALAVNGLIAEEFRLPLVTLNPKSRENIVNLLRRHELLIDT